MQVITRGVIQRVAAKGRKPLQVINCFAMQWKYIGNADGLIIKIKKLQLHGRNADGLIIKIVIKI